MLDISKLMALSEASSGFVGGSVEDTLPGMSLTEATGMFPIMIMENQLSLYESIQAQNESLVEATISAISEGTQLEAEALIEASFESIKKNISTTFGKIKEWLQGIISKIGAWLSDTKNKTSGMIERLKKMTAEEEARLKSRTFNGYDFNASKVKFPEAKDFSNYKDLVSKVGNVPSPEELRGLLEKEGADVNQRFDSSMRDLSDMSPEERKFNYAKALVTGVDLTMDGWDGQLKAAALGGDKVDMKYGTGCFTKQWIMDNLSLFEGIKISNEYKAILKGVEAVEKELSKAASDFDKLDTTKEAKNYDDQSAGNEEFMDASPKAHNIATLSKYYAEYLKVFDDCTATVGRIKHIHTETVKVRHSQALRMVTTAIFMSKKDKGEAAEENKGEPAAAEPKAE